MRGSGRIYRRGNIWWIQYNFNGKTHWESSGSIKKVDARNLLRDRLGEIGKKGRLTGPSQEKVTLNNLGKLILDDYQMNRRASLRLIPSIQERFVEFFGDIRAIDLRTDKISSYIVWRQSEKIANATIKNELSILKRMFSLAIKAEMLDHAPHIPMPAVNNARKGFFEEEDFRAVLAHLPTEIQAIAKFAYLTGWRRGEILSLHWKQVDFEGGVLKLDPGTTKNKDGRTFPFVVLPELADLIRSQRKYTDRIEWEAQHFVPLVFHRDGKEIKDFYGAWRTACKKAGVPGRLLHDFRRTSVRNLTRSGVPQSVAMKLTGHKTASIYRRYDIVDEKDLSEGVKKLAAFHTTIKKSVPTPSPNPMGQRSETELRQFEETVEVLTGQIGENKQRASV